MARIYNNRSRIEKSYEKFREARALTTTPSTTIRLFYVGVGFLLEQLWIVVQSVLARRRRGGQAQPVAFTFSDAFLHGIEQVLDKKISQRKVESPAAQRLLTIPGVGETTAATVLAEVGEIERFDRDKELVSYAGLDPEVHQSGDTEVRGSISKEGSAPLRWTLDQSEHVAVGHDEYLGSFYTRLKRKKNHQIVNVARYGSSWCRSSTCSRVRDHDPLEVTA